MEIYNNQFISGNNPNNMNQIKESSLNNNTNISFSPNQNNNQSIYIPRYQTYNYEEMNKESEIKYDKTQYTLNRNPYHKNSRKEERPTLINLENMDWRNHSMRISSPHSLHIMRENNIEMEELYLFDFFEFREKHPEIIPLNLEIQKSHYYNDLNIREEKLKILIKARRDLLFTEETKTSLEDEFKENEEEKMKKIRRDKLKKKNENELERVKEKEKKELLNMLENQVRRAYIEKQNMLKMKLDEDKEMDKKEIELQRRKAQEKYNEYLKKQRILKEKREAEKQKKIYDEYYEKEQKKRKEQEIKEKENKRKAEEKEKIRLRKAEEFKIKTEEMEKKRIQKINEREEEMIRKENNRKIMMEIQRENQNKINQKKRRI